MNFFEAEKWVSPLPLKISGFFHYIFLFINEKRVIYKSRLTTASEKSQANEKKNLSKVFHPGGQAMIGFPLGPMDQKSHFISEFLSASIEAWRHILKIETMFYLCISTIPRNRGSGKHTPK
jgi:hypothetical protein